MLPPPVPVEGAASPQLQPTVHHGVLWDAGLLDSLLKTSAGATVTEAGHVLRRSYGDNGRMKYFLEAPAAAPPAAQPPGALPRCRCPCGSCSSVSPGAHALTVSIQAPYLVTASLGGLGATTTGFTAATGSGGRAASSAAKVSTDPAAALAAPAATAVVPAAADGPPLPQLPPEVLALSDASYKSGLSPCNLPWPSVRYGSFHQISRQMLTPGCSAALATRWCSACNKETRRQHHTGHPQSCFHTALKRLRKIAVAGGADGAGDAAADGRPRAQIQRACRAKPHA